MAIRSVLPAPPLAAWLWTIYFQFC